ncbi:PEPxxWA-CTERM sorting domain-containing protein [Qipengyuania sp.]|uniref:PEPxxWA-CTERM sorting domain-containing protein n=1 Tax=Qipengyuania sp. TaxID=2004515 RepID=UPI0037355BE4
MRLAFFPLAASLALVSASADAATYVKGSFRGVDPVTGLEIEGRGSFLFREQSEEDIPDDVVVYLEWVHGFVRVGDTTITPENVITTSSFNSRDGFYQWITDQFVFRISDGATSFGLSTVSYPRRGWDRMGVENASATIDGTTTTFSRPNISGYFYATAVPEPMTWALLILGFGTVGGAMRRAKHGKAIRISYS